MYLLKKFFGATIYFGSIYFVKVLKCIHHKVLKCIIILYYHGLKCIDIEYGIILL